MRYQADMQQAQFIDDPAQEKIVAILDELYHELLARPKPSKGFLSKLGFATEPIKPTRGLYIWGSVGRGKTYLVDLFYDCLPFVDKKRTHFHRFMKKVHFELKQLRQKENPLTIVAEHYAKQTRILCFDEFVVNDITDAMILAGLLENLFSRGVTLVATSNIHPDNLYEDGLQRDRFLPAIEMIKSHTQVVEIGGDKDYRLEFLENAEIYLTPTGESAEQTLLHNFLQIAPESGQINVKLEIEGREISALRKADGVVWFDFYELCEGPRSQNDYIELASCFHTFIISRIPVFTSDMNDQARRFINLVDILYDNRITLIVSAAVQPEELYQGKRLNGEFKRTASRLSEMQSKHYLAEQRRIIKHQ